MKGALKPAVIVTLITALLLPFGTQPAFATLTATSTTGGTIYGRDYYANPNPTLNCSTGFVLTSIWSNNTLVGSNEDYSQAFAITCTKLNDDRTLSATTEKITGLSTLTPDVQSACTSGKAANAIRVKTIAGTGGGNTWVLSTGTNCVNSVDYSSPESNALANNTTPTAPGTVATNTSTCQAGSYVIGVVYESGAGLHEVGALCGSFPDTVPPIITGPGPSTGATSIISIPENTTSVFSFTANETSTWSISGVDAAFFSISASGVLTITARNFEAPADDGTNNTYIVAIRATDAASNAFTQTLTVTITDANEGTTIGLPSVTSPVYKGVSTSISVSIDNSGKARFFVDGKRIAKCLAVATTGSATNHTATCNWKPTVSMRHTITVTFTPSVNTFTTVTTTPVYVMVQKRATTR